VQFLNFYRSLPFFKGKYKLGKLLFGNFLGVNEVTKFTAHHNITYLLPNTVESLGVELFLTGTYERKAIRFLREHIKTCDNFFDIGANIGAIGLPVLKDKPDVKYFGFEASPIVFDYLKYNFKKNNIKKYELHNYIVHDYDNQLLKFYQVENYAKGSLAPTFNQNYELVNSISLDSFCYLQQLPRINWIKIDVQGFELSVFRGLEQYLLKKKVDNILFEFEPWEERAAGLEVGAAQKYLISLGYGLFDISGKKIMGIETKRREIIWARPK
jgi:FkbM family methyltransferase